MEYRLKSVPEDFIVQENLALPLAESGEHAYVEVRKRGVGTIAAARYLAELLAIKPALVVHAGLKDEEAVTTQWFSVPSEAALRAKTTFTPGFRHGVPGGTVEFVLRGFGEAPLSTGLLPGNTFRIVARDVSLASDRVSAGDRLDFAFLNLYGPQRFGPPGGLSNAPEIGRAIVEGRWGEALQAYAAQHPDNRTRLEGLTGTPQGILRQAAGEKLLTLFISALEASRWNAELEEKYQRLLADAGRTAAGRSSAVRQMYATCPTLPYVRHYNGGTEAGRATMVQTCLCIHRIWREGPACSIDLQFSLPSGAYATVCLDQWFTELGASGQEGAP
ncbi:MAG: tRNA pseudouridine(13) synthase TruD [Rubrivivax sp.]